MTHVHTPAQSNQQIAAMRRLLRSTGALLLLALAGSAAAAEASSVTLPRHLVRDSIEATAALCSVAAVNADHGQSSSPSPPSADP